MKNSPIYIAYNIHAGEDYYVIDNPFTEFAKNTIYLSSVSRGYEYAKLLAIGVITTKLNESLKLPIKNTA